ncbi:hypothetical protein [Streptomyces sp. NPDC088915]|uniref:hypothetical protein n=1 Tax=Streptomyces sp. NPDC088915 TaxID=3365912 RepID=UPI0038269340
MNAFKRGVGVMVADVTEEGRQVSARQRSWIVAGVAAAGCAVFLGFLIGPLLGGHFLISGWVTIPPLFLRDQPGACARACLLIGTGLLAWSLIGAVLCMFLFLPAALLLLVAAFVDPGNRPGARWAVATPLAVAAFSALLVLSP